MPLSSMKKKTAPTTLNVVSRPSLIETMLLTSTPLRRPTVLKEKNEAYEDIQLLNLTKSNKKDKSKEKKSTSKVAKKRSRSRRPINLENELDETDDDEIEEIQTRKKTKQKANVSKQSDEPIAKRPRRTAAANSRKTRQTVAEKSSDGTSDGCTSGEEETRLIERSKLYIEGPGIRQDFKKINEHNAKIGEKIENLHVHSKTPSSRLPSPIYTRESNRHDVIIAPAQSSSPVKIKTASRITFALPPQTPSTAPANSSDPVHQTSPQMPPTTTATSIDTQTEGAILYEKQTQTGTIPSKNLSVQTDPLTREFGSMSVQCQSIDSSEQHNICRDLTSCNCVKQLVKTREFLVETSNKLQSTKVSKQSMTIILAKSSLKAEQQIIFEQFLSQFHIHCSSIIDDTTTHLITDSLDENTPLVCPLTLKVIQATARHLPIVSIQWLVVSLTHQIIVPSDIYEIFLGDPTYGYHGGFLRSRIPRTQTLFNGIQFRLECPEEYGCPAILADNHSLRELIHLCGGTIINQIDLNHSTTTTIVLCNEMKRQENNYTAYVKPEWLLASIAHYNLQPFRQFAVN